MFYVNQLSALCVLTSLRQKNYGVIGETITYCDYFRAIY